MGGSEPQPVNSGPSPFALFAPGFVTAVKEKPYQQADLFCFYCHASPGSYQSGLLENFDYSHVFGGYAGGPTSIFEAFNQPLGGVNASYHNLYDIWSYAQKFPGFGASSPPCDACHNVHRARRNKAYPQDPAYTAISRPTEHESLWGDVDGERMTNYSGAYQAPLHFGSRTTYEPGGTSESVADGSKVPDYNTFCLDCHKEKIYSTSLRRDVVAIEWKLSGGDQLGTGDKHGANAYTVGIQMKKPYDELVMPPGGYLLSCLDCHEAHGSPSAFLVRRSVNGEILGGTLAQARDGKSWAYLCGRCHQDDYHVGGSTDINQVNRWRTVHHGGGSGANVDVPYQVQGQQGMSCGECHELSPGPQPIGCGYCHNHGSYCNGTNPGTLPNGKVIPAPIDGFRRTF